MTSSSISALALAIVCALGAALIALTMVLPNHVLDVIAHLRALPIGMQALYLTFILLSGVGIALAIWTLTRIYDAVMDGKFRVLKFTPPYRGAAPGYYPQQYVTRAKGERPQWECISPSGIDLVPMKHAFHQFDLYIAASPDAARERIRAHKSRLRREYLDFIS